MPKPVKPDKQPGRKPDYSVYGWVNDTEIRGTVGAAWGGRDGIIDIKLNPFVVLPEGIHLRLYPNFSAVPNPPVENQDNDPPPPDDASGDNVPF